MKIDHIAIFVQDLERSKEFYEDFFGAVANDQYHNPGTGLRTYFLTFDDHCRLELMYRPDVQFDQHPKSAGWAHAAFSLGSRTAVDSLVARLRHSGYSVTDPRTTGDGYYEAIVLDPEGNPIELTI